MVVHVELKSCESSDREGHFRGVGTRIGPRTIEGLGPDSVIVRGPRQGYPETRALAQALHVATEHVARTLHLARDGRIPGRHRIPLLRATKRRAAASGTLVEVSRGAPSRQGLDVLWIPCIVAQGATELGDGLIEHVLPDHHVRPGAVDQPLPAHHLRGPIDQMQKHGQCFRVEDVRRVSPGQALAADV